MSAEMPTSFVVAAALGGGVAGLCLFKSCGAPAKTELPKVMFGTATLGNLYAEPPYAEKKAVIKAIVDSAGDGIAVFDSAGKYGAGLALEVLGQALEELGVPPEKVLISNKLAWKRVPLTTPEPTFEPGAWVNLKNDAVQDISYQGIIDCFENGNKLLGKYDSGLGSVHDPDEYLNAAKSPAERKQREADVLGAYKALMELRAAGKIASIGVGAKDITAIDWIVDAGIKLDWAMFACSITPYSHGDVAKKLLKKLGAQGVDVINSAVFNGGFLTGGSFFDYREVTAQSDPELFAWRDKFNKICADFNVKPAAVCVQFSFLFPEIKSIALATSKPSRVNDNIALAEAVMPAGLWDKLEAEGLINLSEPK